MKTPHHPTIESYLAALRVAGKANTARTYEHHLRVFQQWLGIAKVDLLRATTEQLAGYQVWLSKDISKSTGTVRARSTQGTAIIVVQSFYSWMLRRNLIVFDPSASLVPPSQPGNRMVRKDHLTLQEATALIQTQAILVEEAKGSRRRANELRNLALLSLALATGRRVHGLVSLRVEQIDLERNEIRVEMEKGHTGRVLPVANWAMVTLKRYLNEARVILVEGMESDWLFVSQCAEVLSTRGVGYLLENVMEKTIKRNPDLTDLPHKRISTHSLRVSFATLLFQGGCNIRSINELMLHQRLSTTARYTPIPIADLRRALLTTHLRA